MVAPVRAQTVAKSLAIGNPADGPFAIQAMKESGGWGEAVSDEEIVAGIRLLAQSEGIFTETAGGVTVAVARKLVQQGKLSREGATVLCITGNGLKTPDAVSSELDFGPVIDARIAEVAEIASARELAGAR